MPQAALAALRKFAILACLCLLPGLAAAQSAAHMRFTRLPNLVTDDPSIVAMLQDRQGFVWLGALNGGLYRYDGGRALKFLNDPLDETSLPGERVNSLYEDKAGRLWVGTTHGLARFNPESNSFTRFVSSKTPGRHKVIRKIISDGKDGMWLGTWGGLQHFDPATGKFVVYKPKEGDPSTIRSDSVEALAMDVRGGLWIALWPNGLDYMKPDDGTFQHFRVDTDSSPDASLNKVDALQMDSQNRLWIGTRRGVYRWNDGSDWNARARVASPDGRINNFYPARDGGMWAVTMTDGVLRWPAASDSPVNFIYRPNDPYSLPTLSFQSVMQDRSGMLWVGSYNAGVLVANPGSRGLARIIPPELPFGNRQPNNTTAAIAPAPNGRIWLGGLTGVSLFDPATTTVENYYRAEAGRVGALSSDTVNALYQQPGGPLWVATLSGLNRLDAADGPFTAITFPGNKGSNSTINAISPGAGGKLWLGTNESVIQYDPASGEHHVFAVEKGNPKGRHMQRSNTLLEDQLGRVWMGSEYADGLDMLDQRTGLFQYFEHDDANRASLLSNFVTALHQDRNGRLWAGTAKGLDEIVTGPDGKISFRPYPAAGANKVFAVQSDLHGKIWLTTSSSLIRLDPDTGKASHYGAADGLVDGYRVGAGYAAEDGSLYFAGATGIVLVHPDQVAVESTPPLVAITDISVLNRSLALLPRPEGVELTGSVTAPKALELSSEQSVFSIEFAALHFADPGKNRYAYQLVGFDRDWVAADAAHRNATYTNLDPGNYVFKVKAANDRGLWNEDVASMSITVLPPFWKTWWFRLLSAGLAIALLAAFYRARVAALTRGKRTLEAVVAARTGELAESNAKLAALSLTDGLTGLTNRRGFDAGLADGWARAKRSGEPVTLAMLDVDHFKLYNDAYGHQAGDQCLRAVASVIAAHARRPGDMAARYGGEEFALLTPSAYGPDALTIAAEMCAGVAALALPHASSPTGYITVSIGVASLIPGAENSFDQLVRMADNALYRAKREGRNRALLATEADDALHHA
jgi:diguanylate cyclase (GGDEF)-like protein